MTTRSDGPDEEYWRGASGGDEGGPGDGSEYAGPPPTEPPPPGWRPPIVVQPPPPRQLPPQDEAGLDRAEESARTLTLGVSMLAGAVLLIVICVLCSRAVF
ncbi:MAG TPA: translation initiation factor 2 [Micromonosporaceae bacterium]